VQGAQGLEFPLTLRLTEPAGTPLAAIAFDRALIQAAVADAGQQNYHARFLLHRIQSRAIDLELPAAPATINLEVWLDGKRLTTWQTLDDDGREADTGRIARLRVEPELYRKPVVLDLRYQLPPGRDDRRWQATLSPPALRGNVLPGRVRWQVATPSDWVIVPTGDASPEQRLGLRNGLPAPRPAATAAELERWFNGGLEPATAAAEAEADPGARTPELVASQSVLGPLSFYHFAQQTWLLGCSLAVVALGLVLYFAPLPRVLFWSMLTLLGIGVLVAGLLWPSTLPAFAYGCQPGLVVLLVVIGVQWSLQRRYRNQVVFMPAFSRTLPGSSVIRGSGSSQRRHEPSTVDAPPGVLASEVGSALRLPQRESGN
jgi:hypothetical protein